MTGWETGVNDQTIEERIEERAKATRAAIARRAETSGMRNRIGIGMQEHVDRFGTSLLETWIIGWLQGIVADHLLPPEVAMADVAAVLAAYQEVQDKP